MRTVSSITVLMFTTITHQCNIAVASRKFTDHLDEQNPISPALTTPTSFPKYTPEASSTSSLSISFLSTTSFPPSSTFERYLVMGGNTNHCNDGYTRMASAAKCEEYAGYRGLTYKSTEIDSNDPKGCYLWGSNYVYFNTHTIGCSDEVSQPICKPLILSWSSAPSITPLSKPSTSPTSHSPTISYSPTKVPTIKAPTSSPSNRPMLLFSVCGSIRISFQKISRGVWLDVFHGSIRISLWHVSIA